MHKKYLLLSLASLLLLPSCESIREGLGFEKDPPKEFIISTKPALTLPPDYNLRPPQPGERVRTAPSSAEVTYFILTGREIAEPENLSGGERNFLDKAGASDRNAGVRIELDNEARQTVSKDPLLVESIAIKTDAIKTDSIKTGE